MNAADIRTSGLIDMTTGAFETHTVSNYYVGNTSTVDMFNNAIAFDGTSNQAIDIYFRSQAVGDKDSDTIVVANNFGNGASTFHVSDWSVIGDVFGAAAPIDRLITLTVVDVNPANVNPDVVWTATTKEIKTALGWYQMFPNATPGLYDMVLARYSAEALRGPIALLGTWLHQLTINDILFQHAHGNRFLGKQLEPNTNCGLFGNTRGADLWIRTYGGLDNVKTNQKVDFDNGYWGAILGVDFYTDLVDGMGLMTTPYIGYMGGQQKADTLKISQNGLRAGIIETLYVGPFRTSLNLYGGFWETDMNVGTVKDNLSTNFFLGAALKLSYDLIASDSWTITPSLMSSYTWFDQQDWESDYGHMRMHTDAVNGFAVAPGITFSYVAESFSLDINAQYFWVTGGIKGSAGNVDFPRLELRNKSYLEASANLNIPLTDRLMGYIQGIFYGIDRTGGAGQVGVSWKF
jgi:hypothetical protein